MRWWPFGKDPHEGEEGWYDLLWMWHPGKVPELTVTTNTQCVSNLNTESSTQSIYNVLQNG